MQVRIEDVSEVEKKLIVEVPWDTVNKKLTAAYRELSRSVQLRGFRKGKVPRSVLQRMYGKHVRAEVTSQLVRESFISATSEHDLQAVAEPRVDEAPDIKKGQPFSFEAIVEVKGEVVAKDYQGLDLERPPNEVKDEEIDARLEQLRQEHAELLPIEGRDITARTDVLTIHLSGKLGEHEIDNHQMNVDLTHPEMDPLPGLMDALTGLPINVQDHEVSLELPETYHDKEIAGTTVKLTVSISDARNKTLPELDDEFAKDLDRGETLDELRESIRETIQERHDNDTKTLLHKKAIEALVKGNQIAVASALVDRAVQLQHQRLTAMFGGAGADVGFELTEDLREKMRPAALEEVRGELLLEAVGKQENIEVTDERLDEEIAEMASRSGTPTAKMRAELDRDNQLDSIKFQIRRDLTLDYLVEHANIAIVEPSEASEDDAEAESGSGEAGSDADADASAEAAAEEATETPDSEPAGDEPDGSEKDE